MNSNYKLLLMAEMFYKNKKNRIKNKNNRINNKKNKINNFLNLVLIKLMSK
jgi:hypothetical protein